MGLWAAQKGTLPTEPQPQDLNIFPCNQLLPLYLVPHQLLYKVVKGHQAVRGRPKPSMVTWGRTTLGDRRQNSEVPEQGCSLTARGMISHLFISCLLCFQMLIWNWLWKASSPLQCSPEVTILSTDFSRIEKRRNLIRKSEKPGHGEKAQPSSESPRCCSKENLCQNFNDRAFCPKI